MFKWIPTILAVCISWYIWRKAGYRHQRKMMIVATYYFNRFLQPRKPGDWPLLLYHFMPPVIVSVPVVVFLETLVGMFAKTTTDQVMYSLVVVCVVVLGMVGLMVLFANMQLLKGPLTKLERGNSDILDYLPKVKRAVEEAIVRLRLEKFSVEKMGEEAKKNRAYYLENREKIEQAYNGSSTLLYGEFKPFQVAALALRHLNEPDDLELMNEAELGELLQKQHSYEYDILQMVGDYNPAPSPKTKTPLSQVKRLLSKKLTEGQELIDARRDLEERLKSDPDNAAFWENLIADIDSGDWKNWGRD